MDTTRSRELSASPRFIGHQQGAMHRGLGFASITLGGGLIVNSLLGPFLIDAIDYPWSESMRNQAIGLEAVSLFLVAPVCILAGILCARGRMGGPVIASGPAAYVAYMFLQYVIGPEYDHYAGVLPLQLALFALGAGTVLAAWNAIDSDRLPRMARRTERRYAALLLVLAAFIVSRYLPALASAFAGDPLQAEFRQDISMYWSIVLLDLGIVVPATITAAVGLLHGAGWSRKALYAVIGWFALVPPSVAAMGIAMVANNDPNAAVGQVVLLTIAALAFAGIAIRLYRPLLSTRVARGSGSNTNPESSGTHRISARDQHEGHALVRTGLEDAR